MNCQKVISPFNLEASFEWKIEFFKNFRGGMGRVHALPDPYPSSLVRGVGRSPPKFRGGKFPWL